MLIMHLAFLNAFESSPALRIYQQVMVRVCSAA